MADHYITKPRTCCNVLMVFAYVGVITASVYFTDPYRDPAQFVHEPGDAIDVWTSTITSPKLPFTPHDPAWIAVPPLPPVNGAASETPASNATMSVREVATMQMIALLNAATNLRPAAFQLEIPRADTVPYDNCRVMGNPLTLSPSDVARVRAAINDDYRVTWYADYVPNLSPVKGADEMVYGVAIGLPQRSATPQQEADGVALGPLLYTHYRIVVRSDAEGRVLRWDTAPMSHRGCGDRRPQTLPLDVTNLTVTYTYTLDWVTEPADEKNPMKAWDTRFSAIAEKTTANAQIESTMVGVGMIVMLVLVLFLIFAVRRVLSNDASALTRILDDDGDESYVSDAEAGSAVVPMIARQARQRQIERNWMTIRFDVFRKPRHATCIGACTVAGLHWTVVILVVPACTVFMYGAFMSARVALVTWVAFIVSSPFSGYLVGRIAIQWRIQPAQTRRMSRWASAAALGVWIPFVAAWFDPYAMHVGDYSFIGRVALVAVTLGSYAVLHKTGRAVGWRVARFDEPVETKSISGTQPVEGYSRCARLAKASVLLLLSTVFSTVIPLYYVVQATWGTATVALTGVLFFYALAFVISTALVASYNVYLQLRQKDHVWQGMTFATAAVSGCVSVVIAAVMYGAEFERYAVDGGTIGRILIILVDVGFVTFLMAGAVAHAFAYRSIVFLYRRVGRFKLN